MFACLKIVLKYHTYIISYIQDDQQNASVHYVACSTFGDGAGNTRSLDQNCARNNPFERPRDFRTSSPYQRVMYMHALYSIDPTLTLTCFAQI